MLGCERFFICNCASCSFTPASSALCTLFTATVFPQLVIPRQTRVPRKLHSSVDIDNSISVVKLKFDLNIEYSIRDAPTPQPREIAMDIIRYKTYSVSCRCRRHNTYDSENIFKEKVSTQFNCKIKAVIIKPKVMRL